MPTIEKTRQEETYREIPASILEDAPEASSVRIRRFARYIFGGIVLAAFGLMGYLAITNQFAAEDAAAAVNVEQLVAEYEAKEAERRSAYNIADSASQAGGLGVLEDVRIQIASDPDGASVEIDAQHVGTTPLAHMLRPGAYIFSISKADYGRIDTVLVFVEGGQEEFSFNLTASGLEDSGETARPVQPPVVDNRESDNRESPTRRTPGETHNAAEASRQSAQLVISSHPAGASVVLDGRMVGSTPLSVDAQAGSHSIRLHLENFEAFEQRINASSGETTSVHGELLRKSGEVSVLVRPWGSIYIDGVLHEAHTDVRYSTSVPTGEHTVVAVHPTLGSVSKKVQIRAGGTTSVVIDLESDN